MDTWQRIRMEWSLAGKSAAQRRWLLTTGEDIEFSKFSVSATYERTELAQLVERLQGERQPSPIRMRLQAA